MSYAIRPGPKVMAVATKPTIAIRFRSITPCSMNASDTSLNGCERIAFPAASEKAPPAVCFDSGVRLHFPDPRRRVWRRHR